MKTKALFPKNKLLQSVLYKILKILKRKGMSTQLEMENTLNLEPGSWLIWIKGEKIGNSVEIKDFDNEWINFTDGTRIAAEFASEYMTNTSPGVSVKPNKNNEVAKSIENAFAASAAPVKEPADPIVNMLKTLSKKNSVEFPISLNVKIPSPAMYGVMTAELEEADLKEAISKMIIEQIDIDSITQQIKSNTHTFINNYYGK